MKKTMIFNESKSCGSATIVDKEAKLQDDLQEVLTDKGLSQSQVSRAKKIARNGRDAVIGDNGSVMDEAYSV